jgi:(p)ppGpp synthase/HD superfamily hydrolase
VPYINHLAEVAALVAKTRSESDPEIVAAAYLHDCVEDGHAAPDEIEELFGARVRCLVEELTDDMSLAEAERKLRQVEHVATLSAPARLIKLADKVSNVHEIADDPPADWPAGKRRAYVEWGIAVVDAGCRGLDPALEAEFDRQAERAIALAR